MKWLTAIGLAAFILTLLTLSLTGVPKLRAASARGKAITVKVQGCAHHRAHYVLPAGATVADAMWRAGGPNDDGIRDSVLLLRPNRWPWSKLDSVSAKRIGNREASTMILKDGGTLYVTLDFRCSVGK